MKKGKRKANLEIKLEFELIEEHEVHFAEIMHAPSCKLCS